MKKLLLVIGLFISFTAMAQDEKKWMLEYGTKGLAGTSSIKVTDNTSRNLALIGATLHYRYLIQTTNENQSISLGTHFVIGAVSDEFSGDVLAGLDVPFLVEFNLGRGATRNSTTRFGVYAGGGYDFMISSWSDAGTLLAHGPMFNTGVKFKLLGVNYHLLGSIMKPVNYPGVVIGFGGILLPSRLSKSGDGGGMKSDTRNGNWEWIR